MPRRKSTASGPRTERRTKTRFDPAPAVTDSSSSDSDQPEAHLGSDLLLYASRKVYSGRRVDFKFLEDERFQIGRLIKDRGWKFFCSLSEKTYPELVKEFYCNLRLGDKVLESTIRGVKIVLTEYILGCIWNMVADGDTRDSLDEEERKEISEILTGYEEIGLISVNSLSAEHRLLHHICGRLFLPKTGGFDRITQRDLLLMWNIIKGKDVNLPALIMRRMTELRNKRNGCLPYGMALTCVFKFFKINLEQESSKKLMAFDVYNEGSLHRMNFIRVNDQWVPSDKLAERRKEKTSSQPSAAQASSAQPTSAETPVAPTVTPQLTQDQLDYIINGVAERIQPQLTALQEDVDKFKDELEGLRTLSAANQSQLRRIDSSISSKISESQRQMEEWYLKIYDKMHFLGGSVQGIGFEMGGLTRRVEKFQDVQQQNFRELEAGLHYVADQLESESTSSGSSVQPKDPVPPAQPAPTPVSPVQLAPTSPSSISKPQPDTPAPSSVPQTSTEPEPNVPTT